MHTIPTLIELCKKRDRKGQSMLYALMKKKWMGVCVRYVKDADDAKDVFQEASLKIFSDITTLKQVEAFEGWARRIVVNVALNYIKRRRSYLLALQQHAESDAVSFDRGDEQLLLKMDNVQLLAIINEMPEGYRLVFNLFMIDGYKHAEIAQILSIEESTSRSQLNKAKRFLKKILETQSAQANEKIVGF